MRSSSKAGLFLIELIIIIAFFAVASSYNMRLFVQAHVISAASESLNMAVNASQSAAECFRAVGGDKERMLSLLPGSMSNGDRESDDQIIVKYNSEWQPYTDGDPLFYEGDIGLLVLIEHDGPMAIGKIYVVDYKGTVLFELEVQHYNGTEAAA